MGHVSIDVVPFRRGQRKEAEEGGRKLDEKIFLMAILNGPEPS